MLGGRESVLITVLAFVLCLVAGDENNMARYDNYRLYRVHLKSDEHVNLFQNLEERSDSYTFYGHARHVDQKVSIMVASQKIAEITEILKRYALPFEILVRKLIVQHFRFGWLCFHSNKIVLKFVRSPISKRRSTRN